MSILNVGIDDQRQRKKDKSEYRNDDAVVHARKKVREQPQQNNGDAGKSDGENCEQTRHKCGKWTRILSKMSRGEWQITASTATAWLQ